LRSPLLSSPRLYLCFGAVAAWALINCLILGPVFYIPGLCFDFQALALIRGASSEMCERLCGWAGPARSAKETVGSDKSASNAGSVIGALYWASARCVRCPWQRHEQVEETRPWSEALVHCWLSKPDGVEVLNLFRVFFNQDGLMRKAPRG